MDRILVQGKPNTQKSVTQYRIKISTDGVNYQFIEDDGRPQVRVFVNCCSSFVCLFLFRAKFIYRKKIIAAIDTTFTVAKGAHSSEMAVLVSWYKGHFLFLAVFYRTSGDLGLMEMQLKAQTFQIRCKLVMWNLYQWSPWYSTIIIFACGWMYKVAKTVRKKNVILPCPLVLFTHTHVKLSRNAYRARRTSRLLQTAS